VKAWEPTLLYSVVKRTFPQKLISRLDAEPNVTPRLVYSNNIKNSISDIRDTKRRIMACPWNLG